MLEPGAAMDGDDALEPAVPRRRLVAAGCSRDHCLVYYERRGEGRTWQVALFHWTPEATRVEFGCSAPAGLSTLADVRRAVLSGTLKGPVASW
jgi:hypothetical protein